MLFRSNRGATHAVANAGHGSAPDIAGRGIANPVGMILSSAMLIDHLGVKHSRPEFCKAATAVEAAVDAALQNSHLRTPDLGGSGGTKPFAQAVCDAIKA